MNTHYSAVVICSWFMKDCINANAGANGGTLWEQLHIVCGDSKYVETGTICGHLWLASPYLVVSERVKWRPYVWNIS